MKRVGNGGIHFQVKEVLVEGFMRGLLKNLEDSPVHIRWKTGQLGVRVQEVGEPSGDSLCGVSKMVDIPSPSLAKITALELVHQVIHSLKGVVLKSLHHHGKQQRSSFGGRAISCLSLAGDGDCSF